MANIEGPGPLKTGSEDGGAIALQFVSMNPSSEIEKERNKKVIRSTAMKSFRRKQTKKAQDGTPFPTESLGPSIDSRTSRSPDLPTIAPDSIWIDGASSSLPDISWLFSASSPSVSGSSYGDGSSSFVLDEFTPKQRAFSRLSTPSSSAIGSPKSLGAGRIDPFRIYPVDTNNSIPELFNHFVTILWPGLNPQFQMPTAWFRKAWERPMLMHALAFGAIVHMDVLRSPRLSIKNPLRLFHKVQTMRLLKEEMKNPDQAALDDVILAIMALSTNEVESIANGTSEAARSPFNSPLASIQWQNVYGSVSHVEAHTQAMRSVVTRRGGLETLELPGLADTLFASDILGATQNISKPHFLLRPTAKNLPQFEIEQMLKFSFMKLGRGFEDLVAFGVNATALEVLRSMANLSMAIDGHTRGIKFITDMGDFILRRNAVQHNLLSLPSGEELAFGEVSNVCLYESIRHAAMIYSVAVTYPMPPLTGIFGKLAKALKNILEESKHDLCWQLSPKTLLWILILGGIAATDTNERFWFVQNVEAVSGALNLSEWGDVVTILEEYLWLESACDNGGRMLWSEVVDDRFLQLVAQNGI